MPDARRRSSPTSDSAVPGGDDEQWWNLFSEPSPPVPAASVKRNHLLRSGFRRNHAAAALGAVAAIGAVLAWVAWSPSDPVVAAAPQKSVDPTRSEQLRAGLPSGYAQDSCDDVAVDPGSVPLAVVQCGPGVARAGPDSATFTLFGDGPTMTEAFDELAGRLAVVDCPGGIQSPGPWRVSIDPQRARGLLVCGFDGQNPVVGWTQMQTRILSVVTADAPGSSLAELFEWWSRQS